MADYDHSLKNNAAPEQIKIMTQHIAMKSGK